MLNHNNNLCQTPTCVGPTTEFYCTQSTQGIIAHRVRRSKNAAIFFKLQVISLKMAFNQIATKFATTQCHFIISANGTK